MWFYPGPLLCRPVVSTPGCTLKQMMPCSQAWHLAPSSLAPKQRSPTEMGQKLPVFCSGILGHADQVLLICANIQVGEKYQRLLCSHWLIRRQPTNQRAPSGGSLDSFRQNVSLAKIFTSDGQAGSSPADGRKTAGQPVEHDRQQSSPASRRCKFS